MESTWSRFGVVSWEFPNYSWVDAEECESGSEILDGDSERTRIDYYERSKYSLSSDDTCNDKNYPSDKSDNGSIMTIEDEDSIIVTGQRVREERDGILTVVCKNIDMCTPFAQLVLHKSIVLHAKTKCFYFDDHSWTYVCGQENWISCLINGYPWKKNRDLDLNVRRNAENR